MRKYALLNENVVTDIMQLESDAVADVAKRVQSIIDIEDLVVTPQVGWVLKGNQLAPSAGQQVPLELLINSRIKYYQENAGSLVRELYTANTLLGITVAESDQMFEDFKDVLLRIREGAWPTAIYRLQQKAPAGFVSQQMIDNWIALITARIL